MNPKFLIQNDTNHLDTQEWKSRLENYKSSLARKVDKLLRERYNFPSPKKRKPESELEMDSLVTELHESLKEK